MKRVISSIGLIIGLLGVAAVGGAGAPPQVSNARVDLFYSEAHPGDRVTVTLKATHPQGISKLHCWVGRTQYEGGHGETMGGLVLEPTGERDEFQGTLTVPSTQAESDEPLPAGTYRIEIRSTTDAQGEYFGHDYQHATSLPFAPGPGPQWQAKATGPDEVTNGAPATITIKVGNRSARKRVFEYHYRVVDFFQRPQLEKEGRLTVEPKAVGSSEFSWPTGASKLYRAQIEVSPADSEEQQTVWRYVTADRVAGHRRRMRVDNLGKWEHLPSADGEGGYPPRGESGKQAARAARGHGPNSSPRILRWFGSAPISACPSGCRANTIG